MLPLNASSTIKFQSDISKVILSFLGRLHIPFDYHSLVFAQLISKSVQQVILDAKVGPPSYENGLAKDIIYVVSFSLLSPLSAQFCTKEDII